MWQLKVLVLMVFITQKTLIDSLDLFILAQQGRKLTKRNPHHLANVKPPIYPNIYIYIYVCIYMIYIIIPNSCWCVLFLHMHNSSIMLSLSWWSRVNFSVRATQRNLILPHVQGCHDGWPRRWSRWLGILFIQAMKDSGRNSCDYLLVILN
jgi:hypothetical protein